MPNQSSMLTRLLCLVLCLCSLLLLYRSGESLSPAPLDDGALIGTLGDGPLIAISLGNTNSRVAFVKNGTTHIIPSAQGHNATPNYFAFNEHNYLIGDEAKARAGREFEYGPVISGFTKYLGYNFTSMQSQIDLQKYSIVDRSGIPKYQIHSPFGEVVEYSPTNLTAFLLQSLKQDAERYLGQKVESAIIVAENGFDDDQRSDLKEASHLAGLNIVRILERWWAVTLAYGLDVENNLVRVLVYHLGGSYAEASVVDIEYEVYEQMGHSRDTHMIPTVQKLNQQVVGYIIDKLDPLYALDPVEKETKRSDLQFEAERLQRILSFKNYVEIHDHGRSLNLSRSKFEQLLNNDLKRTLAHVDKALAEGNVSASEIDAIVLSGGSANIPKIQAMLRGHLSRPIIEGKGFSPEEAALFGAAEIVKVLTDESRHCCYIFRMPNVTQLNLGVEMMGGVVEQIVKRGTTLRTRKVRLFTTAIDNQKEAVINVFEGVRPFTKYGKLIGTLTLHGITPAPAGRVQIEVIFDVEEDGILNVTAFQKQTERSATIFINTTQSTPDEIERMVEEGDKYEADDRTMREEIGRLVTEGKLMGKDGELRVVNERPAHEEL